MKVIVSGGGTGGHIYPALAVAKGILARWPGSQVLYVGTAEGMEKRIVPAMGIPFAEVSAKGWQGRKPDQLWKALAATYKGEGEAKAIIHDFKPQAVVGTGGYVCLPVAAAAVKDKVPVLLHEQNAFPGLTNRLISLWAKSVMITFAEAKNFFPKSARHKVVLTGLPVRREIQTMTREKALARLGLDPRRRTLLAVGGSRGAQSINLAMLHVIKQLYGHPGIQILHACGQRDYEMMKDRLGEAGIPFAGEGNIILKPYIDEMEYALGAADLCIGRAGAAFLAEMTICGVPGILIPYPYAAGDHQTHNAKSLEQKGAAILLQDSELKGPLLLEKILQILADGLQRQKMQQNSLAASRPEALEDILGQLEFLDTIAPGRAY